MWTARRNLSRRTAGKRRDPGASGETRGSVQGDRPLVDQLGPRLAVRRRRRASRRMTSRMHRSVGGSLLIALLAPGLARAQNPTDVAALMQDAAVRAALDTAKATEPQTIE